LSPSLASPATAGKRSLADRRLHAARNNASTISATRIRETIIRSSNAPRVSNVNFTISVGTVVPRTVRLVPLPTLVVDVEPAWDGYLYFIVGDEIIVVEPNTLKIVAVIAV
jgi:hypothetical protein